MELDKLIEQFRNEKLQEPTQYIEPSDNRFDAPIPGQSLTDEPGNYPWEHPPQRASVEEALDDIYESLMQEKNMKRMFTLLRMGIPVEALVKIITFAGFLEGKYTVDVAKLLEPMVSMIITGEATLAEIPAKINIGDAEDTDFYKEMAGRKYDMKLDKEQKDKQMEMPMEEPANIAGLMARGE
tara:strand:+ start:76 stop:624 length:549 start_codon:yes stop_codon:yes gene_type:complete